MTKNSSGRLKGEGATGDQVTIASTDSSSSDNVSGSLDVPQSFEDLLKICGDSGRWQLKVRNRNLYFILITRAAESPELESIYVYVEVLKTK